jgi:iron complex transport system substrate-binding protein
MLGYRHDILVLDHILISIIDIAERVGRIKEGRELVVSLQKRIDYIVTKSSFEAETVNKMYRPKVLCIEWIDPLYSTGHRVPQMVEIAGVIGISSRGSPLYLLLPMLFHS